MLKLNGRELTSLALDDQPSDVPKLDISNNLLTNLDGIEAWQGNLKWLNASHNQIKSIKHIKQCTKLTVLNLGYNKLTSTKHLNKLKELNALILNNNDLECLDNLSTLKELNTLVVSSNKLENIDLTALPKLQKVSASHNQLKEFPSLQPLKDIKDLKLNNNKIEGIPEWFIASCIRVKVLDLGNNNLNDLEAIKNLCKLPYLENLNLKGNLVCTIEDYHIKMKELFPNLKILDFKKMSELYFKAIDDKSKKKVKSHDLKENSTKPENSDVMVDETPNIKDASGEANAHKISLESSTKPEISDVMVDETSRMKESSKTPNLHKTSTADRGFRSSKIKPNDSIKSVKNEPLLENNIDTQNDNRADATQQTVKQKKRKRTSENLDIDQVDKEEKKKKKKKKDLVVSENDTEASVTMKDLCNSKEIETKKTKKKNTKFSKSDTKKSGVVAIKTVKKKKKKSTLFNSNVLQDELTSFGMGESNGWS